MYAALLEEASSSTTTVAGAFATSFLPCMKLTSTFDPVPSQRSCAFPDHPAPVQLETASPPMGLSTPVLLAAVSSAQSGLVSRRRGHFWPSTRLVAVERRRQMVRRRPLRATVYLP